MDRLNTFKTHLRRELTQLGITDTRESTDIVVKKGRVVGYVIANSWQQHPQQGVDIELLLSIIANKGGYGTIRTDGEMMTLQVSISLN